MKLSIAVLFFIGFACAIAFADVSHPGAPHGNGCYGILTTNGYKPGNFQIIDFWFCIRFFPFLITILYLIFFALSISIYRINCWILKHLKKITKRSGYGPWQKWFDSNPAYDVALIKKDMPALANLFQGAVPVLRELDLNLLGSELQATLTKIANECQQLATKLASGHGTLVDIDTFLKMVSRQINESKHGSMNQNSITFGQSIEHVKWRKRVQRRACNYSFCAQLVQLIRDIKLL